MKIFISYGHDEHADLANRLKGDLERLGHKVWLDEKDIHVSHMWEISIEKGINSSDWIVVMMTPYSIKRPDGVCLDEVSYARYQGKKIAPIMVENVQPPLAIARIQWLDMQNWKCSNTGILLEDKYEEKLKLLSQVLEGKIELGFEGEYSCLRSFLNPIENGAEISKHTKRFVGREWIFKDYNQWLLNDCSRVFWLKGPAGIGKTAFAAMLCHRESSTVGVHFCKHNDSVRGDPKRAISSLAYYFATQNTEYMHYLLSLSDLAKIDDMSVTALFSYLLLEPLQTISVPDKKVVIVLDALDEAGKDGKNELATVIGQEFDNLPDWFKLVITSRPDPLIIRKLSRLNPYELSSIDAENIKDIGAYLNIQLSHLKECNRVKVIDNLIKKSEGIFLYIHEVLKEIESNRLSVEDCHLFPEGLSGVYIYYFERLFPDLNKYKEYYRPLFELLVSAQEPLNIKMATEILSWDEYETDDILDSLGSLFYIENTAIEPFHKTIFEWLLDRNKSGEYKVSEDKGHVRFCDYIVRKNDRVPFIEYINRFGPYHLYRCDRFAEIVDLVNENEQFAGSLRALVLSEVQNNDQLLTAKIKRLFTLLIKSLPASAAEKHLVLMVSLFIDYSLFDAAKKFEHLLQELKAGLCWLNDYIEFRLCRMVGQPKMVEQVGRKLISSKSVPESLLTTIHYYLADGLREQGFHSEAISHYEYSLKYVEKNKDLPFWLKGTCALADMEYVYGLLPEAMTRLKNALALSVKHDLALLKGQIFRMIGNVEHIRDNLTTAQYYFHKSLEEALKIKRPYSIVEAYNSLAEAKRIDCCEKDALWNVHEARKYALKYNANLELGKGYYIEAIILLHSGKLNQAEEVAERSLEILKTVGYGSGIARSQAILARVLFQQRKDMDEALKYALSALKYYQREQIYPSLRIETYHTLMQCAEELNLAEQYAHIENVSAVPNILNFPSIQELVDKYR